MGDMQSCEGTCGGHFRVGIKAQGKANRSVGAGSDASLREVEVVLWGVVTTE